MNRKLIDTRYVTPFISAIRILIALIMIFSMSQLHGGNYQDLSKVGESYRRQGIKFKRKGDFKKAIAMYDSAIFFFQKNNDSKGLGNTYNNLGIAWFYLSGFERCLDSYLKSLKYFQNINNEIGQAKVYLGLSTYYGYHEHKHDKAYKYLQLSKEIFVRKNEPRRLAMVYNNLGNIFIEDRFSNVYYNIDSSLWYFHQAADVHQQLGDSIEFYGTLLNIARTYEILKGYEDAQLYLNKCLRFFKKNSNTHELTLIELNLGNLYKKQN